MTDFQRKKHIAYFKKGLLELHTSYSPQEVNRITFAYFCVVGLDILRALDEVDKDKIVSWVYSLQVIPTGEMTGADEIDFGFRGSPSCGFAFNSAGSPCCCSSDGGHLAMTYVALAILVTLGDDLRRVHKAAIIGTISRIQSKSLHGSFMPMSQGAESDLRFVFCASAISAMLQDWSGMDKGRTSSFIAACRSYDAGFSLNPGHESHGGATYCALASLKLMGCLPEPDSDAVPLLEWCIHRQVGMEGGFQGRRNKPADTCYAFWVGGSLSMLGSFSLVDKEALRSFLLTTQHRNGGFSKLPGSHPDVMHSFYGVCGFSLLESQGTLSLLPELGLSARAVNDSGLQLS